MSIRKIIWLNALLALGIGIYGILTDEPYWRSVGHFPELYDFLFWAALALNGPSGFAADYAAWFVVDRSNLDWPLVVQHKDDWQFLVQYGFGFFGLNGGVTTLSLYGASVIAVARRRCIWRAALAMGASTYDRATAANQQRPL